MLELLLPVHMLLASHETCRAFIPYAQIRQHLAAQYRERPVLTGPTVDGQALQVLASPDLGTWTALIVTTQRLACVVATGRNLEGLGLAEGEPS